MNDLYIECNSGVTGDMLMSALLDLYDDKEGFIDKINSLNIEGAKVSVEEDVKNGIAGKKATVNIGGFEAENLKIINNQKEDYFLNDNISKDTQEYTSYGLDAFEGGYHDFLNDRDAYIAGKDNENETQALKEEIEEPLFPLDGLYAFEEGYDNFLRERANAESNDEHTTIENNPKAETLNSSDELSFPPDSLYAFEEGFDNFIKEQDNFFKSNVDASKCTCEDHKHFNLDISYISGIIDNLDVSEKVKQNVKGIYDILLKAETSVQGYKTDKSEFFVAEDLYNIVYIVGICYLIENLEINNIISSPINIGYGNTKTPYGTLPVPVPLAAYILRDVPIYTNEEEGELSNPIGCAVLKYFCKEFTNKKAMTFNKVGYGLRKKELNSANLLRVFIGKMAVENN